MSRFKLSRAVPAGQVLFEIGSPGREFYIILNGECAFYQKCPLNKKEEIKMQMAEIEKLPLDEVGEAKKRTKSKYPGTFY